MSYIQIWVKYVRYLVYITCFIYSHYVDIMHGYSMYANNAYTIYILIYTIYNKRKYWYKYK